jgi:hypothetical protein
MGFQPNWNEVQPEHKWSILLKQKRFLLWAIYTSVGGMMIGTFLPSNAFSYV